MIDKLINLVRQHAGDDIINNNEIPNQHNDAAIDEVGHQIYNGMQGHMRQADPSQVSSFFGGNSHGSHPMLGSLISSVAGGLGSKFGLPHGSASSIAGSLVPKVMSQFVRKTNDPSDRDFDLSDIMSHFGGGGAASGRQGGLGSTLGKMLG